MRKRGFIGRCVALAALASLAVGTANAQRDNACLGDIWCSDGKYYSPDEYAKADPSVKAQGVVYWVAPNGKNEDGRMVALRDAEKNVGWSGEKNVYDEIDEKLAVAFDIKSVDNQAAIHGILCSSWRGKENSEVLRGYIKSGKEYPAMAAIHDEQWYLPSIAELLMLSAQYRHVADALAKVIAKEGAASAETLRMRMYYSSSINGGKNGGAFYLAGSGGVRVDGQNDRKDKTNMGSRGVRPLSASAAGAASPKADAKIGDLVDFGDGSKGVLVHVERDGKSGWAVALKDEEEGPLSWANTFEEKTSKLNIQIAPRQESQQDVNPGWNELSNPAFRSMEVMLPVLKDLDGQGHTAAIRAAGSKDEFPAAYAVDFDKGWYLPAAGQMQVLFSLEPFIKKVLEDNGGEVPEGYYWTSTPKDRKVTWYLSTQCGLYDYENFNEGFKVSTHHVRAMRNWKKVSKPAKVILYSKNMTVTLKGAGGAADRQLEQKKETEVPVGSELIIAPKEKNNVFETLSIKEIEKAEAIGKPSYSYIVEDEYADKKIEIRGQVREAPTVEYDAKVVKVSRKGVDGAANAPLESGKDYVIAGDVLVIEVAEADATFESLKVSDIEMPGVTGKNSYEYTVTAGNTGDTKVVIVATVKSDKDTFTLAFDGNGATGGSMAEQTVEVGKPVDLPMNAFTRENYTFLGWSKDKTATAAEYTDGAKGVTINGKKGEKVTLYAVWKADQAAPADTFTLTFDGNGATGGSMAEQTVEVGKPFDLPMNAFTRENYTFLGWSKDKTATAAEYTDGAKGVTIDGKKGEKVTLYAVWKADQAAPADTFTLAFDGNGATGGSMVEQTVEVGKPFDLPMNAFTRENYTFLGWSKDKTATAAECTDGAKGVTINGKKGEKVTLYAVWKADQAAPADTFTLAFDGNGATGGSMVEQPVEVGKPFDLPMNAFTRENYTFLGWSKDKTATAAEYTDGAKGVTINGKKGEKVTLYAVWKASVKKETAVESELLAGVQALGNPFGSKLTLIHTQAAERIEVFSIAGRSMYTQTLHGVDSLAIATGAWNSGVYIVRVVARDGERVIRVVKR